MNKIIFSELSTTDRKMNVTIPSMDYEDEDEEEIQQVQPVVTKPKPKSYAKFEPILKRKIDTLKENPFEFEYGEKMDEHYLFVLQLMQRADEKCELIYA
jgi:hypothetical protein